MQINNLLTKAIRAAEEASKEIIEVYNSGDFQAQLKGDNSPLTIADKRAHHCIIKFLESTGLPILSEEGKEIPYDERKDWEYFWMIDPLDGTKEFLKKNGEFTVNIALIYRNVPVLGVVAVPATGEMYYGTKETGAYRKQNGETIKLLPRAHAVKLNEHQLRVVASRSHMNEETEKFITSLQAPSLVSSGSSLKFMLLINGKADVYPRFAPTMEWDTAASQAIVNCVGVGVFQLGTKDELIYNKMNLLNPNFIAY